MYTPESQRRHGFFVLKADIKIFNLLNTKFNELISEFLCQFFLNIFQGACNGSLQILRSGQ